METLPCCDVRRGNAEQMAEFLGDFNKWVTGEAVGHDPTPEECFWHYYHNGGPEAYRRNASGELSQQRDTSG